jgi:hypothetical protein
VGQHVYPRTVVSVIYHYKKKIQLSVLVWYKADLIIIPLKINLFSPWYSWKIAELVLNNNHSLTPFLAHLAFRPCELLSSLFDRRPSVNISHFNLLLRNHWANCNQTLVEWSLDGPLLKLCPVIPTSNQDGHQAKNRKKGGWNFNCPLLL